MHAVVVERRNCPEQPVVFCILITLVPLCLLCLSRFDLWSKERIVVLPELNP